MAEETEQGAMAPFDAISAPPPAPVDAAVAASVATDVSLGQRVGRKLGTPGLVALVALALGFGQSLALLKFFGGDDEHLSAPNQKVRAPAAHPAEAHTTPPQGESAAHVDPHLGSGSDGGADESHSEPTTDGDETAMAISSRPLDVLDTAREMLDRGDVAGARRIATAYLLRIDGMGQRERARASAAYAVLGDAMRAEYALAVDANGGGR